MNYSDGRYIQLGDRVRLGSDASGIVVGLIDVGEYCTEYPESAWGYLKTGALINFASFGVIHYEQLERDLKLVERGSCI